MKEYVYEFIFCDCVFESSYTTISLHKTMLGAYKAMRKFIIDLAIEHREAEIRRGKDIHAGFKWNFSIGYSIRKREINP